MVAHFETISFPKFLGSLINIAESFFNCGYEVVLRDYHMGFWLLPTVSNRDTNISPRV